MTRQADYAILLLTHVASKAPASVHAARDLAAETHVPLPMVSKVLKSLARSHLLISHRGVKGGYQLSRRPTEITLADIISAVDGPIEMTDCISGDCRQSRWCPVERNWRKVNAAIGHALASVSLADMTAPMTDGSVTVELELPRRAAQAGGAP